MTTVIYIGIGILILVLVGVIIFLLKRPVKKKDASLEYTTALNYLITGEKEEALKKLRDAVLRDTSNIDAYLKIGDILREQGFVERAIKIHRGLLVRRNLNSGQRIDILKSLIKDYQLAEKYDRAIRVADLLVDLTRNDIWAQDIRLKILEAAGEWDKAIDALKSLQKTKGEKDKTRLALYKVEAGLQCIEDNRERDGRLKFREAIKLDKNCPPAYLYLSDSYIRENRYEDALTELKKFITQVPDRAYLAFNRIKEILFHIGTFGEVENIFRDLLEKHPENEPIRFALADIYERKGELQKAIDLCYNCLERNSGSQQAKRYLVKFLSRTGEKEEAIKYALELIEDFYNTEQNYFTCRVCGYKSKEPKWRCPECLEWDTFLG